MELCGPTLAQRTGPTDSPREPHGAWYFNTGAGKEEILLRRIGRIEIAAMRICQELVDAQKEFYAEAPDGEVKQYAQKFVTMKGNTMVCIGRWGVVNPKIHRLCISYAGGDIQPADSNSGVKPFYGYYFQILTQQGEHAQMEQGTISPTAR